MRGAEEPAPDPRRHVGAKPRLRGPPYEGEQELDQARVAEGDEGRGEADRKGLEAEQGTGSDIDTQDDPIANQSPVLPRESGSALRKSHFLAPHRNAAERGRITGREMKRGRSVSWRERPNP